MNVRTVVFLLLISTTVLSGCHPQVLLPALVPFVQLQMGRANLDQEPELLIDIANLDAIYLADEGKPCGRLVMSGGRTNEINLSVVDTEAVRAIVLEILSDGPQPGGIPVLIAYRVPAIQDCAELVALFEIHTLLETNGNPVGEAIFGTFDSIRIFSNEDVCSEVVFSESSVQPVLKVTQTDAERIADLISTIPPDGLDLMIVYQPGLNCSHLNALYQLTMLYPRK